MKALIELKKECFNRISGSYCKCCYNENPKQLLIHHLSYTEKSITYNKFDNSDDGRLKYYSNLLDEIKMDINNFVVLCFDCHQIIEKLLKMEWIDAYNFCNGNNCEFGLYEEVWKMSYDKRDKNNLLKNADDVYQKIQSKRSELEDFL